MGPPKLPTIPDYGEIAVEVKDLTFSYDNTNSQRETILENLNLSLEKGARCLLIGANGSGKSTLLRILSGRHLTKPEGGIRVLGLNPFRDTKLNFHIAHLNCDWGMRNIPFAGASVPLMADIAVREMMAKLQGEYPERRDELVEMLGINLDWRMHLLSEGQRRRAQIFFGLLRPFKLLLLDEVTTSLDVCVRQDLLRWLEKESIDRGATIIYATHIFDGLDDWGTNLFYLTDKGSCGWQGKLLDLEKYQQLKVANHPAKMLAIAEHWLRLELIEKRKKHQHEKAQGDLAHVPDVTDHHGGFSSGRIKTSEMVL